jgi:hypothetical protein
LKEGKSIRQAADLLNSLEDDQFNVARNMGGGFGLHQGPVNTIVKAAIVATLEWVDEIDKPSVPSRVSLEIKPRVHLAYSMNIAVRELLDTLEKALDIKGPSDEDAEAFIASVVDMEEGKLDKEREENEEEQV